MGATFCQNEKKQIRAATPKKDFSFGKIWKKIPQKAGVFELGACETFCDKLIFFLIKFSFVHKAALGALDFGT